MCAPSTEDSLVDFVTRHAAVICKFRVTAPSLVIKRTKHLLGENAKFAVETELSYLGGDAQVATQIVLNDIGAALIFRDPIGINAAACDCDALLRLINVHNIMSATNPRTAEMLIHVLHEGITTAEGNEDFMPSFYQSLESPSVQAYMNKQNAVIAACSTPKRVPATSAAEAPPATSTAGMKILRGKQESDFAEEITTHAPKLAEFLSRGERWDRRDWGDGGELNGALSHHSRAACGNLPTLLRKLRTVGVVVGMVAITAKSNKAPIIPCDNKLIPCDETERHMAQARNMRCLALISHNNMKGAMKKFVKLHQNVLKRFRLTGTSSTMTTLKTVLGEDGVEYGPTCSSGPLGGDAEVGALMCVHDLGGMFFFTDPLDPHPHAADINALIRMADLHNLMHASNPTTGDALIRTLEKGLDDRKYIPTFYETRFNPAVEWHKTSPQGVLYRHFGHSRQRTEMLAAILCTVAAMLLAAYVYLDSAFLRKL